MTSLKLSERYPYTGTFELTGRCNLNCRMCYVHVDQNRIEQLGKSELTTAEWKKITDEVFEAGTIKLLLTGGEPMVRKDFTELYEYIARKGFFLTLYTNATMVTDEIFDILKRYPPHTIGITLYGMSNDTYKKVCQRDGAYDNVLEGIKRLLTLPSKIEIRTTITQDNLHEAHEIEAYIKSFGKRVTFNINQTVFKSGRNSIASPETVRLTPKENAEFFIERYQNLAEEALERPELKAVLDSDAEKGNGETERQENELKGPWGCMAGWQDYTVAWDGSLLACQLIDQVTCDCRKLGFVTAWNQLKEQICLPQEDEKCKDCKEREFCGVCPASRYCETGSFDSNPRYFCELAEEYSKIFKVNN